MCTSCGWIGAGWGVDVDWICTGWGVDVDEMWTGSEVDGDEMCTKCVHGINCRRDVDGMGSVCLFGELKLISHV